MAVSATYTSSVTSIETLSVVSANATHSRITHSLMDTVYALDAETTPPATEVVAWEQMLTAGSATIDLTSITVSPFAAKSLDGLKVQAMKIIANAENENPYTLTEGASDGYELLGNAWKVVLQPGQEILIYGNDATPDVGATTKTIDCTGTDEESVSILIVAG